MNYENSLSSAQDFDKQFAKSTFRNRFHIPKQNGKEVIYLAGNSLGLLPKAALELVEQEFTDWGNLGVDGHFDAKNPWFPYHHFVEESLAKLCGALKNEVAAFGSLTANLHLLMVSFYRPDKKKYKIMMEANAFPSDQYAIESQVRYHGFEPDDAIIEATSREGEHTLRTADILDLIEKNKDSLALILFGGVNYLSGQLFDMKTISEAGHRAGITIGFDLAHAMGNAILHLHDWGVDFACWCSYKYLNSGPGGVAGIFVHEKHCKEFDLPRFAGWWGYEEETRFQMKKGFRPQAGAAGWQVSNAPIFALAIHRASLQIFDEAGIENLRMKSKMLTGFLEFILNDFNNENPENALQIITPKNADERGCQLSLAAKQNGKAIFKKLSDAGAIADWREPNVIRMSPVPLYNTFEDVWNAGTILKKI
jgi:kynureninase